MLHIPVQSEKHFYTFNYSMNNIQRLLFLAALLAISPVYAQPIQFSNGDILEAELKYQTDKTITFSHAILGEQTIDKAKTRNLQELNLERVYKFTETELNRLKILKGAKTAVTVAKHGVIVAEVKLVSAKDAVDNAQEKNKETAEEKLILAADNLTAAQKEVTAAEDNLKTLKNTVVAESELLVAQDKFKVAKAEVKVSKLEVEVTEAQEDAVEQQEIIATKENLGLAGEKLTAAQEGVKVSEEELRVIRSIIKADDKGLVTTETIRAAEAEFKATGPDVKVTTAEEKLAAGQEQTETKEKLEIAEENFEIAEEKVEVAKQQVEVAEDNLKLAKGEKVNDGFMGTGWFKDWDSSISIGLSGSSGSSVNSTFRTAFNTRYEDKAGRWDFKSFYFLDSEDKIVGENQVNATLVKDWFFEDTKWFAFATGVYDWNQFKDWNHRLQFGGGPGYQFIKTDTWEFAGRAGLTLITEFDKTQYNGNGDPIFNPDGSVFEKNVLGLEGLIGADLTWHITSKQHFSISNYFYPSLTDGGQFRNLTNINWIHSLDWFEGLALKFGIRNEYDTSESIPNEFNYNFSVLWGF